MPSFVARHKDSDGCTGARALAQHFFNVVGDQKNNATSSQYIIVFEFMYVKVSCQINVLVLETL